MPLLSPQDEQVLTQHLSALDTPVTLLLFTQAIGGSESGAVAKQVLDEVARLSDKITVVDKSFVLDVEDREKYGVGREPAIVPLSNGEDTRIRFYGAPTGYEFVSLVEGIMIAGTRKTDLADDTQKLLTGVAEPLHLQVFSTPT
jgi:alkyl hydroperoxide reductase subunit AhpF